MAESGPPPMPTTIGDTDSLLGQPGDGQAATAVRVGRVRERRVADYGAVGDVDDRERVRVAEVGRARRVDTSCTVAGDGNAYHF